MGNELSEGRKNYISRKRCATRSEIDKDDSAIKFGGRKAMRVDGRAGGTGGGGGGNSNKSEKKKRHIVENTERKGCVCVIKNKM